MATSPRRASLPPSTSQLPSPTSQLPRLLLSWYRRHRRDLPWRSLPSPYAVTVSEFMLQQTQVATVIPYFERWLRTFPDWASLAGTPGSRVLKLWEGLGYYSRARNLHRLAKAVMELPGRELPPDPAALRLLPGIGPYTAGAIASIAFGKAAPLVDGNVERVLCRVFDIRDPLKAPATQKKLWALATDLVPKRSPGDFNQALMELGARICTPRAPKCSACPVHPHCAARDRSPELLPVRTRPEIIKQNENVSVITHNGKVWLLHPETPGRWRGLHRLPLWDAKAMAAGGALGTHRYTITKYRVTARLHKARWKSRPPATGAWHPLARLPRLTLPSPHRRMLESHLITAKNTHPAKR